MTTRKRPEAEPVYYCGICGHETKYPPPLRFRKRENRDHTDWRDCIAHLRSVIQELSWKMPNVVE